MRTMKDSGIEWIGEIPQGWKIPPLRSKYAFSKGLSITKADLVDEGVCVISYGQIHSKDNIGVSVRDSLIRHLPANHGSLTEAAKANVGDLIFADTSEDLQGCGNCVFVDRDDIYAGYHTLILRPKEIGLGRYYAYLFAADAWRAQVRAKVSGVKLFSITQDILKSTALLEPPEEEQGRIVDYLDTKCSEIDALIAAKAKTNALLKERRQSIIYEAVTKGLDPTAPMKNSGVEWIGEIPEGWSVGKLGYFIEVYNGDRSSNYPSGDDLQEEGIPFLTSSNLEEDIIDTSTCKYISEEKYNSLAGFKMRIDDIVYCLRGSVGKCAINKTEHCGTIASSLMGIRCKSIDPDWSLFLLKSSVFSAQNNLFMNGTCAANLSAESICTYLIPVCPIEEQRAIADYLIQNCKQIGELIKKNSAEIQKLKEYRQSLIYEAVTGKIEI